MHGHASNVPTSHAYIATAATELNSATAATELNCLKCGDIPRIYLIPHASYRIPNKLKHITALTKLLF